jgi:hypothetical protein
MRIILPSAFLAMMLLGVPPQGPRDALREMQKKAEKQAIEKNYRELREAARELAELSMQISADVDQDGEHVISARIFERLDKIEKLTKRIRDRAKGSGLVIESGRPAR